MTQVALVGTHHVAAPAASSGPRVLALIPLLSGQG
jgi:hypothetical protein